MMKIFLFSFLTCDAVSISKSDQAPNDLLSAGGVSGNGAKLVATPDGTNPATTVPGAMNGKKWALGASKLKSGSSSSFSAANWLKRNEIMGDGISQSKTRTATFAQQGKATAQDDGNSGTQATDDKRLWSHAQTYSDDAGTYKIGGSLTGKTLGKTERHVAQNYAKSVGEKYNKNGILATSEGEGDIENTVNSSHWLYKKGRHSFDFESQDALGEGSATKDLERDLDSYTAITNGANAAMYSQPTAGSQLVTKETNWKGAQFPDVQAKQLHFAATKGTNGNEVWRTTDKDAAGAIGGDRDTEKARKLSHEEWIKATYQQAVICKAGVWAGTDGCVMSCGYTDGAAGDPCKDATEDDIVIGEDADGDANKCGATNSVTTPGSASCGSCLCKATPTR